MSKEEEIKYLRNLLTFANHKIVNLSKPYDLTINEIQQEVRSLEQLREILLEFEQPVEIHLEPQVLGKKR